MLTCKRHLWRVGSSNSTNSFAYRRVVFPMGSYGAPTLKYTVLLVCTWWCMWLVRTIENPSYPVSFWEMRIPYGSTLWISIYIQMWVPLLVLQAWNSYPSPCRLRLFGTLPMMHQLKRTLSIKQLKLALERPGRWWVCTNVICPVYKQSVCCVISILIDLCFMMMNLLTLGPWGGHCAHTRTHNAVSLVKRTVGKDGKKRVVSWWHVPYLLAMMRKWYRLEWRFEKKCWV